MSFASLSEAYGNSVIRGITPESVYKRPDVFEQTSSQELMYLLNPNTTTAPVKTYGVESFTNTDNTTPPPTPLSYQKHQQPPQPPQQQAQPDMDHAMFILHMNSCKSCQHKFGPRVGMYNVDERVLNTLIYIVTMIFILFLLDIFVRLGSVLARK